MIDRAKVSDKLDYTEKAANKLMRSIVALKEEDTRRKNEHAARKAFLLAEKKALRAHESGSSQRNRRVRQEEH